MAEISPATQSDAQAFCGVCQWVYECWTTHANLFECLPKHLRDQRSVTWADFSETPYGRCLDRLNTISQAHSILQMAKLHDPAVQGRNENLSIDFFVKQTFWSEDETPKIQEIALDLHGFSGPISDARNKFLTHNDRSAFAENLRLGAFPEGDDEKYFHTLGQLCSMIWNKFPNRNRPYGNRIFDFTKSGIRGDSLCPSNEARELRKLILEAIPGSVADVGRKRPA